MVTLAAMSDPGSYAPTGRPSRPSPLSPVRIPCTRPSATSSFWASVSGSTAVPSASACSARKRPSCETETTQLPWLRIVGGGGIRIDLPPFESR